MEMQIKHVCIIGVLLWGIGSLGALASTESVDNAAALRDGRLGIYAGVGRNENTVEVAIVGARWMFAPISMDPAYGVLRPATEIMYGKWSSGSSGNTDVRKLHEYGLSGVLRYAHPNFMQISLQPFVEVGFGVRYLSENRIEQQDLGQHMQFASQFGLGMTVKKRIDLTLRLRHLSNGGLADRNAGINHLLFLTGIRF